MVLDEFPMGCEQQSRMLVQRERGSWWPILYANDSRVPLLQTTRQTAGKKQNKHRDHDGEEESQLTFLTLLRRESGAYFEELS